MKKLVSFATAISLIASMPISSAHAEEQTELEKLAVSLGSETDHVSALNKNYPLPYELTDPDRSYTPFIPAASGDNMPDGVGIAEYSDTSLGTSVISILTHNGVISAGDVMDGVETLSEITNMRSIKFPIYKYQNLMDKSDFRLYIYNLLKNQTLSQKTDSLISTAEKCMNEGKYFLIMYSAFRYTPTQFEIETGRSNRSEFAHSAVGMGVTDGEWTFNGKKYDKCILTLDSYSAGVESDAFSEDTCIYINSETKECYMPKLSGHTESDINIIAIDNDKLLNFEETDIADDMASINIIYSDTITEVSYTDENGNEVILNEDNDFLDNYHQYSNNWFIAKGDNFRIYTSSEENIDYMSIVRKDYSLSFQTKKADNEIISSDDTLKIVRKDPWGVTERKDEDPLIYNVRVSRATPVKDFQLEIYEDLLYNISGETMTDATFTQTDDGLIFGGGKVKITAYNDNKTDNYSFAFQSDNEVLIKCDENFDFSLFIDRDNDGTFEYEVEQGDVNCDGRVDAVDASVVLNVYADLSTNNEKNPKEIYADLKYGDINNDGMINAVDASIIASIYAQNSTR